MWMGVFLGFLRKKSQFWLHSRYFYCTAIFIRYPIELAWWVRVCWLRFVPWCHRLCKTRFLKSFRRRLVINHFRTCFKIRFSKFVKKYLQSFSCLFISNRRAYLKLFTFDMQVLLFLKSILTWRSKIESSMWEKTTHLAINSRILKIFMV